MAESSRTLPMRIQVQRRDNNHDRRDVSRSERQRRPARRDARPIRHDTHSSRRAARSERPERHESSERRSERLERSERQSSVHGRRIDAFDGLRAICALGVVGYHMGLDWLSGGLLGVTVLFVLSGYLATDSLLAEFGRSHTIDVAGYYLRRIRRLMPQALLVVVVTAALCTLCNHQLLTKMRPDVIPSLLMYLNWSKIVTKVSYFAAAGAPSPLTHFWSLAIEWQFYLVWPVVLLLVLRLHVPKKTIRMGLIGLAALSAILMAVLYVPGEDPSRSYYGTDTRAMSLLLGCWLAFIWPLNQVASKERVGFDQYRLVVELAAAGSVVALIALMVLTEGYTSFSYYGGVALVSVLSVIAAATLCASGTITERMLSLPPFVWMGKRAYALYLWHYPIVLLLTNQNSTTATPLWLYGVQLLLSLMAADFTYRFVERPCSARGAITGAIGGYAEELRTQGSAALRRRLPILGPACVLVVTAVCGLVLIPPVQAVGGSHHEERVQAASLRTPTADGVYDVVLIGDSVPLDAYDQLAATFPNGLIDCKISRQLTAGIDVLQGYMDKGVVGNTVVSCLGSNGAVTEAQLDQLLAVVGDTRTLWLVNNRMHDSWQDANNDLFGRYAAAHDNVGVVDWFGYSAGHDEWVWKDGEHVTPKGAAAYAACLKQAMGYEPATVENTVYSTVVVGDTVALDATDELAAAFPRGAIDCAEGRSIRRAHKKISSYLKKGVVGPHVVIALGAEGAVSKANMEEIITDLGKGHDIWLVTTRCHRSWQDSNNDVFTAVAASHDQVHIIDWYAASEGHDEYFVGDGTNLSKEGAKAYTALIVDAVGES